MRKTVAFLAFVFFASLSSLALAEQRYPMDADEFRQTITARVEATWEKIEKKLDHHKVSEDRKQEIRAAFDEAVARIDQVMDKASTDGQISRGEAYKINTMTSGLRGKLRSTLAVNRNDRASEKREPASTSRSARKPAKSEDSRDEELDSQSQTRKPAPARKAEASPKKRVPAKKAAR
ncbi:MAG: hypothetical protein HY898_07250 [Deltaproteobacteria bacterium]|nr:hypothetical protein [Deltaproteobacteria bacterium]